MMVFGFRELEFVTEDFKTQFFGPWDNLFPDEIFMFPSNSV